SAARGALRSRSRRRDTRRAQRSATRIRRDRGTGWRSPARGRRTRRLDPSDRQRPPGRRPAVSENPPRYASWTQGKLPLPELGEMKRRGEKIVMVTAYDAPSARLADAAGIDLILVGDSSGMVVHGRASTVPVTLDAAVVST